MGVCYTIIDEREERTAPKTWEGLIMNGQIKCGQEFIEELHEEAQEKLGDTGFFDGEVKKIDDLWQLTEIFKYLEKVQDNYHLRINIDTNYDEELAGVKVTHINAQGNWHIAETWDEELKIQPNGTVASIEINTRVFKHWYISVDSMGWIDIFLADTSMEVEGNKFDGDVVHLVLYTKK